MSVSLGSPSRDFSVDVEMGGMRFGLARFGTGGDTKRAASLVRHLDGSVDAIGLGGVNLSYTVGTKQYVCPDGQKIASQAKNTPVVDGEGFKRTYESGVPLLMSQEMFPLAGKTVLLVSVLDRWPLALGFESVGARVIAGDAVFALGLGFAPGLALFSCVSNLSMWCLSKLPIARLYPLGEEQERSPRSTRFGWLYNMADIVAGDFHFIRRHLPASLRGKWVVTSTTTEKDRSEIRERGAEGVVTMVRPLSGRTFGANVLDAMACAFFSQWPLTDEQYKEAWNRFGLRPEITKL